MPSQIRDNILSVFFRALLFLFPIKLTKVIIKMYPVSRSSRPEVSCKKDFLRNFTKLTGKHLCQRHFFNKVVGLRLYSNSFPVNFAKFLRAPFFTEHLQWLLLNIFPHQHHSPYHFHNICKLFIIFTKAFHYRRKTVKNAKISPNLLAGKFFGKVQFPRRFD